MSRQPAGKTPDIVLQVMQDLARDPEVQEALATIGGKIASQITGRLTNDAIAERIGSSFADAIRRRQAPPAAEPETELGYQGDPFWILGLPPTAAWEVAHKRYRQLARVWHPDAGGQEEKFKELQAAYEEIKRRMGRR